MVVKAVDFLAFLKKAAETRLGGIEQVFVPAAASWNPSSGTYFTRLSPNSRPVLDSFRSIDPVKILYYLTRERLTDGRPAVGKRLIVGVKGCDLSALLLLDQALLHGDFVDPAYAEWRACSLIIAADCRDIAETCHCTLAGGVPWAERGYDVNLAQADDVYLLTAATEAGKEFLAALAKEVETKPDDEQAARRVDEQRQAILRRLNEQNRPFARAGRYLEYRKPTKDVWRQASVSCIGCGACTHICPTCYCLILNDESRDGLFIKERSYDSCQWNGYARVAGGGTPRPKMTDRFRNRYLCKFDYMQHNFGRLGCTGCGRCTEACAGKIDFRQVVKSVEDAVQAA
ncbi:MAG: 4Fe-4S dicluster domain-containing protein [candidate division KSB1 bacterium]|nr:4Fe-4S dicluster domain-containing protein [candidate division KSB1 bacterium]MDZ7345491.1 4Fe-4S dicluster domain-containing protein [candidate division KSB1 bacterium]